jgi:hypothetical protein
MGLIPQPVPNTYVEGLCSTTGFQAVSEIFTFNVEDNCSRSANQHLQLMFLNRYGQYDYYTFLFNRYEGMNITRQTYNSWNIDWGSAAPNKTQYSRGLTDSEVDMVQTVVVNSGFINQPDFEFLEELYTSNFVFEIQTDGGLKAVNIINTDFERKIQGNRTIYNLELTYVYSNNIKLLGM